MATRPDTPDIDPKVKNTVEELNETINQVLTEKGREELSNINKQEIKEQYDEYIKKDTEGKKQMIATEKAKLKWGVKLGIFKEVELNEFLNSLKPRPDHHGGHPGHYETPPSTTEVLKSLVVVVAFGAFVVLTPGALDFFLTVQLVAGGSKHKKRKGRKSKKTKKSMKHKKGRKSKKAKKSMKKRKSMKKKKSKKKRK